MIDSGNRHSRYHDMLPRSAAKVFSGLILSFALASAGSAIANAQGIATGVLKRLETHNESIENLQSDLNRLMFNPQIKSVSYDQAGKLYYIPGPTNKSYVRIDWTGPEETLLVVQSKFWLYQKNLNQYYSGKISSGNKAKGADALTILGKSRRELAEEYRTIFEGRVKVEGESADHVRLVPKGMAKIKEVELWVDEAGMPVRIKTVELNNDSTTYSFSNIKKNIRMSADIFKWKPPSNAKKIDA